MLCTLIGAIIQFINIHEGLDMHLYDDIGDASSSLRGWTSSLISNIDFSELFLVNLLVLKSASFMTSLSLHLKFFTQK